MQNMVNSEKLPLGNSARAVYAPKMGLGNSGQPKKCRLLWGKKNLFFVQNTGTALKRFFAHAHVKTRFSYYIAAAGRGYKPAEPMRVLALKSANESATPQNAEHARPFLSLFE